MFTTSRIALLCLVAPLTVLAIPVLDDPEPKKPATVTTQSGLKYQELVVGTGAKPVIGSKVRVHYTGTLVDGKQFDSSYDRMVPLELVFARGVLIRGFEEGISDMKVGGKRKLIIPPNLGYGATGVGAKIPPDATLIFEVELLWIGQ